jgi:hypothetical protein
VLSEAETEAQVADRRQAQQEKAFSDKQKKMLVGKKKSRKASTIVPIAIEGELFVCSFD